MKTIFTFSMIRTLVLMFVVVTLTLNLAGQTIYNVSVANYSFSPSQLTINVGDKVIWKNIGGTHNVNGTKATFASNPESFGNSLGTGWTYEYTFGTAGTYNYQCDPHAAFGMTGKVIVNPRISDPLKLTVNFTSMTPHAGETLWLAVIDLATKKEIGRVKKIVTQTFSIEIPGIEIGKSYWVDFFADHNKNGVYNAPPADHAWRLPLTSVTGNSVIDFVHNTTFTDIAWKTKLTLSFTSMTPHIGQKLTLFVRDKGMKMDMDTVIVPQIAAAAFDISSWKITPGASYNLDFYADFNKNGVYNAPPTDHAWRISLDNVKSDTIISFVHNTNFTDIFSTTAIQKLVGNQEIIQLYPNPASQFIELNIPPSYETISSLRIFSITGALIDQKVLFGNQQALRYDISGYKNGVYLLEINSVNKKEVLKFIKQ